MYIKSYRVNNAGFTLVELSIVLVIVGLLIGGLLIGQSLVEASKINAVIKTVQQYDSAIDSFKTKYKSLPADSKFFGGNGNGIIEVSNGDASGCDTAAAATKFEYERGDFWNNLSWVGFKNSKNQNFAKSLGTPGISNYSAAQIADVYLPKLPIGNNVSAFICGKLDATNVYKISSLYTEPTNGWIRSDATNALKGSEAYTIDQKIDDGSPITGYIKAYDYWSVRLALSGIGSTWCVDTGNIYNVSATTPKCSLEIRMGAQTGSLN